MSVEIAQNGVGEFAIDLDVFLARNRGTRSPVGGAGVAQEAAKEVGQTVGQDLLLFKTIGAAGGEQFGQVLELGRGGLGSLREREGAEVRAENVEAEERFGVERRGRKG